MPFPKGIKRAGEIAVAERADSISQYLNTDLLLKSFTLRDSRNFGQLIILQCETKDGEAVEFSTFSGVVAEQAEVIEPHLPCIISPKKIANYYTIY